MTQLLLRIEAKEHAAGAHAAIFPPSIQYSPSIFFAFLQAILQAVLQ
jgi:hypothetical protein